MNKKKIEIHIRKESDLMRAVLQAGQSAAALGFSETASCMVATAVSELSRNILVYAGVGQVYFNEINDNGAKGIEVIARDQGPGIEDIDAAMQEHFSTGGSLGLGLPGVRRLMDEFEIGASPGRGTWIKVKKWI